MNKTNQELSIKCALIIFPTDKMGGAENILRLVAEEISQTENWRVHCLVLSKDRSGTLNKIEECEKSTTTYIKAQRELKALIPMCRIIRKKKYNITLTSHLHTNTAACLLRRFGVLNTDRLITRESTQIFDRDLGKFQSIFEIFYKLYGNQDLIIYQTSTMKESLEKNVEYLKRVKSKVIPNPVESNVAYVSGNRNVDLESVVKICWCGRFTNVKNPDLAIDALRALIFERAVDAKLSMIGDGPLLNHCKNRAVELDLQDRIDFFGYTKTPELIMRESSIALITSTTEGFPNVLLEFLANGIGSVISTKCAGDLETIPGVRIAEEGSAEEISRMLALHADRGPKTSCEEKIIKRFLKTRTPQVYTKEILDVAWHERE